MRVLLSGYYGYGNLGDEALLAGLVSGLRERGHEPHVLSGDPAATRTLHGVDSAHRLRGLIPALMRSDALVSGGGGLLQDGSSRRSLAYYLTVMRLARLLGKPVVVYGQSIGPLSASGRREVGRVLRGVPLAVRDRPSQALLADLGLSSTLVADPALLLPCPTPSDPGDTPDRDRPVLLIPRSGHEDLGDALAAAGRRLAAAGRPVAVLGLHEQEDAPEVARLTRETGAESWRAATPEQALAQVARAGFVLSVRLHGLIFASVCGVGFAGLVYDPKVAGFLAEAAAPAFARPVDPERLAAVAEAGLAAASAPDAGARLRDRARDGLAWLHERLSARGA